MVQSSFHVYQITFRPINGLGMALDCPFYVVKNAVMKYAWPAQTPSTNIILRTDIHVCVEEEEPVTKHKNTCETLILTFEVLLIHVLLQIYIP